VLNLGSDRRGMIVVIFIFDLLTRIVTVGVAAVAFDVAVIAVI
jgi:hypothetical protein